MQSISISDLACMYVCCLSAFDNVSVCLSVCLFANISKNQCRCDSGILWFQGSCALLKCLQSQWVTFCPIQ